MSAAAGPDAPATALAGITVVETGQDIAAAYCTRLLASQGARVIKVEPPGGDPLRWRGPFPCAGPDTAVPGLQSYLDAGKESIVLDLDQPEGQDLLHRLLGSADLFVSNLSLARRRALELDADSLGARHRALISVALSAFGDRGPLAGCPGGDLEAQALSGVCWAIGCPGREPLVVPYQQADYQAGVHGASAALVALMAREAGAGGQAIDIAAADVLAAAAGTNSLIYLFYGVGRWDRAGNRAIASGGPYPYVILPCRDGAVCLIGRTRRDWQNLLAAMGDPQWGRDPRYQDLHAMGRDYPEEVDALLVPWLKRHTRAELHALAAHHQFPLAPLKTMAEVLETPHFAERGSFVQMPTAGGRTRPVPATPFRFSTLSQRLDAPSPGPGAHGTDILARDLGLDEAVIGTLRASGVLG